MANLESHDNLTKMQKNLLEKGFFFGQALRINVYSRAFQNLDFKTAFKYGPENSETPNSALSNFAYETDRVYLKGEITSSRYFSSTLQFIPRFSGVDLKNFKEKFFYESYDDNHVLTGSVEYSDNKNFLAELSLSSDYSAKLSSNIAVGKGGVVTDLLFDTKQLKLTDYETSLWWFTDKYRTVLKYFNSRPSPLSCGNLEASVFYDHSLKKKIAAIAALNANKELSVKLGLQLNLDESKIFKARIDNGLNLGLSMRNKVSSFLTVVTATQFNILVCDNQDIQFGIKLKFNQ